MQFILSPDNIFVSFLKIFGKIPPEIRGFDQKTT